MIVGQQVDPIGELTDFQQARDVAHVARPQTCNVRDQERPPFCVDTANDSQMSADFKPATQPVIFDDEIFADRRH
jgi:hypothetical protein